jgi:hypothetical protein
MERTWRFWYTPAGVIPMTSPSQTGYYRDGDYFYYVTSAGVVYYVYGPDVLEPVWEECEFLSPDAEPKTPDADDLALFERTRVAYGIPE